LASGVPDHAARAPHYLPLAILTALTLRVVFRVTLRQTEGLIGLVLRLLSASSGYVRPHDPEVAGRGLAGATTTLGR